MKGSVLTTRAWVLLILAAQSLQSGRLSVGDFQSEADADAKAKDREETKRLLYVALTRARDRLYLAGEVPTMIVWGDRDAVIVIPLGSNASAVCVTSRAARLRRDGPVASRLYRREMLVINSLAEADALVARYGDAVRVDPELIGVPG